METMENNLNSALSKMTLRRWRQRFAVGAVLSLCILFLLTGSRNDASSRRYLLELLASKAQAVPGAVPSFMIPPAPSLIPKQNVLSVVDIHKLQRKLDVSSCKITSQVRLIAASPKWILQSIDESGNDKSMGGDEFYVTYTDSSIEGETDRPTAVALVEDLHNGQYELDFLTTPLDPSVEGLSDTGSLRVYFQYSCGIGFLSKPDKGSWKGGGTSSFYHKLVDIQKPPIRAFQPPSLGGICFPDFRKVIGVGDSVLSEFISHDKLHKVPNFLLGTKTGPLNTDTVQERLKFISTEFGEEIRKGGVALMIGSSIWDILMATHENDPLFTDHFEAVRQYIHELRIRMRHRNVTILWMSPSALHVHRAACTDITSCPVRTKYMSTSRAKLLYDGQKEIMEEMGIPFLDLYEAYYASANLIYKDDGIHYDGRLTNRMIRWFNDENDCDTATRIVW